ncbi:MAG: sigma-54-dependent Fis family transcriptional regulator [Planctomycetia bacterium 21-64-5]|nr:MAG: sigma-54-dependent Fis family transcriptional regulator [Planctomycetia bacterium 21-64-5]
MNLLTLRPAELKGRVLVVDDHRQARESMSDILRQAGHQVQCLSSAVEAINLLDHESFDVVITDLQMPGMTGLEFVRQLAKRPHGAQVIMVTAYATVASAVEAMRHGAFDYIEKPFAADRLETLVERALGHGRLIDAGQALPAAGPSGPPVMIGNSPAMRALRACIARAAPTIETILIMGESGTGKELVARAVHSASSRAQTPLVGLNCPVLSAQLMESELFGHERGAFTGAETARTGRFELANGGTILLDEISEIDLSLQAKLLRVLQERTFERVGSSETRPLDVRVLATTNRDLRSEVAEGRFREDLFFRLAVIPLEVPPLRNRREDIAPLTEHFLTRTAARLGSELCQLDASALTLLHSYHWPGNVRELENIITRASVLHAGDAISAEDLRPWLIDTPGEATDAADRLPLGLSLREMERKLIEATLDHFDGHRAKTAEALGIGLRTLSGKLKEYGYAPRTKKFARAA